MHTSGKHDGGSDEAQFGQVIQILVSSGHSWSDVKTYTLAEVGIFLDAVYKKSVAEKAEKASLDWMTHNLTGKKMQEIIQHIEQSVPKQKKVLTPKETHSEWVRLAAFMNHQR